MNTMKAVVKYADAPGATELRDVPVPEIGNTENEKLALVMQVMTALDNALGTTREETIALIIKAAEVTETKTKKNKAA